MPIARTNGVSIFYDIQGPDGGVPLLLIMGFGTQMTGWPESFVTGLARDGFRVVRFDNRDVGLSQKWDNVLPDIKAVSKAAATGAKPDIPYTLEDMADDAATLLDHLGIGSAHVAGASMGGMIAQLVAIRRPDKVRSLIPIMTTTSEPSLPRADQEAQEALMAKPASDSREDFVAHAVRTRKHLNSPGYLEDDAVIAERAGRNYDRGYYPQGTLRQWAAIIAHRPTTERLKKLRVPACVIHGAADNLIKPEAGRHVAASIPGAAYHEIPGWGHNMPESAVPVILGVMTPFMRQVEAERREAFAREAAPGCCGAAAGV